MPQKPVAGAPRASANPIPARPGPVSYECRVADGEVFYRHEPCPSTTKTGTSHYTDPVRGIDTASSNDVPVTSRQISRQEACQKMNSAGAIGRWGRGRDQQVSTYDKNQGADPCK